MLVEIKHHYGWTLHEHAGDLFEAACAATEESHWEIFTPDNHRLERGSWAGDQTHNGAIKVVTLKRLPQFFGGAIEPGEYWFTVSYRRHFPHGTTGRDHKGRRWVHLSIEGYPRASGPYRDGPKPWRAACSRWACIDDPREMMLDYPTLFASDAPAFELDAPPATQAEIVRGLRLWHSTHALTVIARIESLHLTPTQAASELRCGRGMEGRKNLAFRTWLLVQKLKGRELGDERWRVFHAEDPDPADTRAELMRLAGIADLVDAERQRNRSRVHARHVDLGVS